MSQLTDSSDITEAIRAELELLTTEQVCDLLQVSKGWLYDQVEERGFPVVRLGRRTLRFRASDVAAWMRADRPNMTSETDDPKPAAATRGRRRGPARKS